jgi:DNA-directed RNA polymerase subunit H
MPEDEIVALETRYYKQRTSFPRIYNTDPPIVWIGGRPGDMVRIYRPSETVGESIAYRYVVKDRETI